MQNEPAEYPFPRQPRIRINLPLTETPDESYFAMARTITSRVARKRTWTMIIGLIIFFLVFKPFCGCGQEPDKISLDKSITENHFDHFEGHHECGITSGQLYIPPNLSDKSVPKHSHFCPTRARLLDAMSSGGRRGFDSPYHPANCHYRWYTTRQICMILDRFDAVVFIGDDSMKHVYAALNMLLRENIALGGLKQWELSETELTQCQCDNQFVKPECAEHFITESSQLIASDGTTGHKSPYRCNKMPHYFLPITNAPSSPMLHNKFTNILSSSRDSYKPIPVILSLSLSTSLSWPIATTAMDEWISLADGTGHNAPFLWLGPNAAGHLKPPGKLLSEGNNALWHYTVEMASEAEKRSIEALGMWNLTVQATSWDGSQYGVDVALVQAMMVINWLARVEST